MEKLLAYLNSLEPIDQARFAKRCETTVGYIRKNISSKKSFGETLCLRFEKESGGAVCCADINISFAKELKSAGYVRGTKKKAA